MAESTQVSTCLWFDSNAQEAVDAYLGIFENARLISVMHHGEATPGKARPVLSIAFELNGQRFVALNGGPTYALTPAVSLVVRCDTQDDIDRRWEQLSAGGEPQRCGWLKDRFGLSWQIVPSALERMLGDEDPARSGRVMAALMQMEKINLGALEQAYA